MLKRFSAWGFLLTTLFVLLTWAPAQGAALKSGDIQIADTTLTTGERLAIELRDWPQGLVTVELCGNNSSNGSLDCALAASNIANVDASGIGQVSMYVDTPPSPCPCVLRAKSLVSAEVSELPVVVRIAGDDGSAATDVTNSNTSQGDPDETQNTDSIQNGVPNPVTVITSASINSKGGFWAGVGRSFGIGGTQEIQVTIQNIGQEPVPSADVALLSGRSTLSGKYLTSEPMAAIAPGQSVHLNFTTNIPGIAFGRYYLFGDIPNVEQGGNFSVEATTWPYTLVGLIAFIVALGVLKSNLKSWRRLIRALAISVLAVVLLMISINLMQRWDENSAAQTAQEQLLKDYENTVSLTQSATNLAAVKEGDMVGVLRIPSFGSDFELALVEGVSPEQLRRAPGHYPGTAGPGQIGNAVLAGHNARSGKGAPFARLHEIKVGDEIKWQTTTGEYTYVVKSTRVVVPTQTDLLLPVPGQPGVDPTLAKLTLITCDYSDNAFTQRFIVDAELKTS